jgi:glycine betaine/proline transport system substrate-binding protein
MSSISRRLGILLLSAALLTACAADRAAERAGGGGGGGDGDEDGGAGAGESVSLVANPWPGSYANVAVASRILTDELGVDVEIVEIDENAQWPGMDAGDLDAVLEIWPSGHEDNIQTYIEDAGTVERLGELGAVGQIGWFTPTYVVEDNPELATWEGIEGNEELFATAETGDAGRFLAADPSFVQFDETIISNLELDLEVIQSGSEAAQLTAVQNAIEREEPVLFYFYTPHWLHADTDLTMVELPEYEEGCEEPEGERTCGYPEDVLFKAAAADLSERAPATYAFLERFEMRNEWQDEITYMIDVEGMEPQEAADQWVADNEDIWQDWL